MPLKPNFLRGHEAVFHAWGGLPRVLLYDNLKSAVLERQGDAIRFHPLLLAFAAHYRFEPRPVAVARGNEKGRVERTIRYIRDSFFAARTWHDLDDLNAQAEAWCLGPAADRPCPEDPSPSSTIRAYFSRNQLFFKSTGSESRRAQDAKRDFPVALSPSARRRPLRPGSPRSGVTASPRRAPCGALPRLARTPTRMA